MEKRKILLKVIPIIWIASLLFTACDIPDISKFTEQSAEMTRGIRKGVKDTENVIKDAAGRTDLFSGPTISALNANFKNYQRVVKPTIKTLDSLDAYLEALNALSQANKKSAENSKAVVNAVGDLVTAASGITLATSTINIASGLLTAFDQFRTARSFKARVSKAAEIVEGRFNEIKVPKQVNGVTKEVIVRTKKCTDDKKTLIEQATATLETEFKNTLFSSDNPVESADNNSIVSELFKGGKLSRQQVDQLRPLSFSEQLKKLTELNKLEEDHLKMLEAVREKSDKAVYELGCGVIDLLKFTIADLRVINNAVSITLFSNAKEKNRTLLGFYDAIAATDRRTQNELQTILNYKTLAALIRELEANEAGRGTINEKKTDLKQHLDAIFDFDSQIKNAVIKEIETCGSACGNMKRFVEFELCDTCEAELLQLIAPQSISKAQFDRSNGLIEPIMETRASILYDQNTKYLEDLKRITPMHITVVNELDSIKERQNQLDSLLNTSLDALDAWAESHANLRVAVNTDKTLTVSKLTSKVKEIWEIINPKETE